MTDIVERLRDLAKYHPVDMTKGDCLEAADRIEQLHMELIKAGELIDADLLARAVKAEAEIERLRRAVARAAHLLALPERERIAEMKAVLRDYDGV